MGILPKTRFLPNFINLFWYNIKGDRTYWRSNSVGSGIILRS
ncbi:MULTISPECIES: hypothetical protein [unclassified Microcoleus]|nr:MULTISPECIES: hypothetical protein [unclassified Microcoleus]